MVFMLKNIINSKKTDGALFRGRYKAILIKISGQNLSAIGEYFSVAIIVRYRERVVD